MPLNKTKGVGPIPPPLIFNGYSLKILDQTKLPGKIIYRTIRGYKTLIKAIKELKIRGAPLIGIAAAYGLALEANKPGFNPRRGKRIIQELEKTRPTAYNLFWALGQLRSLLDSELNISQLRKAILAKAKSLAREEEVRCDRIGEIGAGLLPNKASVLTICNTGHLATPGIGTALGVIYRAKEKGKDLTVFVCETRPLLQGARLTTFELKKRGIKTVLLTDGMVGQMMPAIDICLTGADRIVRNGDCANKVGTLTLAICANYYKKPFYVVAPTSTIDTSLATGAEIIIEERKEEEITTFFGHRIAPKGIAVRNPAFDVVPHSLITGIITEEGIIYPPFEFPHPNL